MTYQYDSIESLVNFAKEAEGKYIYELSNIEEIAYGDERSARNKGNIGQIIEREYFGIENNSDREPDFKDLRVELKVTPVKQNKNKSLSAKERLVANIINYEEEYKKDFFTSSFWQKNQKLLLVFYLWEKEKSRMDFRVIKTHYHEFKDEDLEVIKKDWELIIKKIKEGKAHEISEGDTNYLGACTKGASRKSLRTQPFSSEPAMQRAFSLKSSYMTTLIRSLINQEDLVRITNNEELKSKNLDDLLREKFASIKGLSTNEIANKYNVKLAKGKGLLPNLISSVLGIKGTKLNKIEEFSKANYKFKTIRIEPNGNIREHMSFRNINFTELAETAWEDSELKEKFESTKWVFVVFDHKEDYKVKNRQSYFKKIVIWNMPKRIIDNELKSFYEETQKVLEKGVELIQTNRGISNNLPDRNFNRVCHIRPKGTNAADKVELPDGQWITKQCFWLDKEYIKDIVR